MDIIKDGFRIYKKSTSEREELKKVKNKYSPTGSIYLSSPKSNETQGKLILQISGRKLKENEKSTYSFTCYKQDIGNILSSFREEQITFNKVRYNGKLINK
jgi:hypothetical protein